MTEQQSSVCMEFLFICSFFPFIFIHSSVDGSLCYFHILAIVSNASMNTGIHVSFQIHVVYYFFKYILRSGISRSYGTQSFGSSHGKESAYLCRRFDFNLWVGRIPWIRQWKTTPYSYLENSTDRGAWWAIVHGVAESDMTEQLNIHAWQFYLYFLRKFHPVFSTMTAPIYAYTSSVQGFFFFQVVVNI